MKIDFSNFLVIHDLGDYSVISPNEKIGTLFIVPKPVTCVKQEDIQTVLGISDYVKDKDLIEWFNLDN